MDKTESLGKSRKALHNGKCFPVFWYDRAYKPGSVLTAIYLAPQLLTGSSHLLGTAGQAYCPTHGVAPDRVYIIKPMSPWAGCALTAPFHPCLVDASSISLAPPQAAGLAHFAASPLPTKTFVFAGAPFDRSGGGISLLHLSWGHPRQALPVILALWSPDFPHRGPFGAPSAAVRPGHGIYHTLI